MIQFLAGSNWSHWKRWYLQLTLLLPGDKVSCQPIICITFIISCYSSPLSLCPPPTELHHSVTSPAEDTLAPEFNVLTSHHTILVRESINGQYIYIEYVNKIYFPTYVLEFFFSRDYRLFLVKYFFLFFNWSFFLWDLHIPPAQTFHKRGIPTQDIYHTNEAPMHWRDISILHWHSLT